MSLFTSIAIFFTVWWTVLFCVLPFGVISHAEAGIDKGDGGDPGAPVDPKIKQKFITTTWISALVFAGIYAWLPLGLKVLKKIEQVVREEMDRAPPVRSSSAPSGPAAARHKSPPPPAGPCQRAASAGATRSAHLTAHREGSA